MIKFTEQASMTDEVTIREQVIGQQEVHTERFGIRGDVTIVERCIKTGKVLDTVEYKNVVLTQGKGEILRAFSVPLLDTNKVKTIVVGNDVGSGDLMNPEDPDASYTEANMETVYTVPEEEFFIDFPTDNSVRYRATLNGPAVMILYPNLPNVVYTSASIFTNANKAVTYKRFPARTISALISVEITWTLTIT
jgi:hypothetical protein